MRSDLPERHPYRRVWETRDVAAWGEELAPELVMYSPILSKPFIGRQVAIDVFASLFNAITEFRITAEMASGDITVFCWRATYRDAEIEGVDVVRLNDQGQAREIRVLVRPLVGIGTFGQALGPPLAATRGAARSMVVRCLNAPLALLFKVTDALASRLIGG